MQNSRIEKINSATGKERKAGSEAKTSFSLVKGGHASTARKGEELLFRRYRFILSNASGT